MTKIFDQDLIEKANAFRRSLQGSVALTQLKNALTEKRFDESYAEVAYENYLEKWKREFGSTLGCLDLQWSETTFDAGQCATWAMRSELAHPLIMACRWGSSSSLIWLSKKSEVSGIVTFKNAIDFWPQKMAAEHGLCGVLEFLLHKLPQESKSQGLASWLVGCARAPKGYVQTLVDEVRPWMKYLEGGVLPLSPSGVFCSGLSAALGRDPDPDLCTREECVEALCSLGSQVWRHETQFEGSELWDTAQTSDLVALSYIEEALAFGASESLLILSRAGFEMPPVSRLNRVIEGWGLRERDPAHREAVDLLWGLCAQEEQKELTDAVGRTSVGPPVRRKL